MRASLWFGTYKKIPTMFYSTRLEEAVDEFALFRFPGNYSRKVFLDFAQNLCSYFDSIWNTVYTWGWLINLDVAFYGVGKCLQRKAKSPPTPCVWTQRGTAFYFFIDTLSVAYNRNYMTMGVRSGQVPLLWAEQGPPEVTFGPCFWNSANYDSHNKSHGKRLKTAVPNFVSLCTLYAPR